MSSLLVDRVAATYR